MAKLTPIERFLSEIPSDYRRAFDARQLQKGLKRVTVTVPIERIDDLKNFARFLRNSDPGSIDMFRDIMSDVLRGCYADWDDAEGRGEL